MNPTVTPQLSTPNSARVRVEGTLDMVRASDQTFTVITPEGATISGRLVEGRSVEELARWLSEDVVLFGIGQFDPAGKLLSVEANGFLPGLSPRRRRQQQLAGGTPEEREEMARRLKLVIGTWPGDETDEEVERALRELS